MIPIPEFLRAMAHKQGVNPERVEDLWERHGEWCDQQGKDYGGNNWRTLCQKAANDDNVQSIPRNDPEVIAARRRDREAKDLIDREYEKNAVSLKDWLGDLRTRDDFGEAITPLEHHVARFRDPLPGEDTAAWLMAAVKDTPKVGRNRTCACGRPVHTWVRNDHRYYAGDCLECWQKARAER